MKNRNVKFRVVALQTAVVSVALSAVPLTSHAITYNVKEIPAPVQIQIPAGTSANKVCVSINDAGEVACNLQIIETLTPVQIDRGRVPKLFASYAYKWNSNAVTDATNPLLLSSPSPGTIDSAKMINDSGLVGGSMDTVSARKPQGVIWSNIGHTEFGPGEITELDSTGDYVLNGRLFNTAGAVRFPGGQVQVEAIYPDPLSDSGVKAAGTQSFGSQLGQSGTGVLYNVAPKARQSIAGFALNSIISGFTVRELDNNNFVMSGIPGTATGLFAFNCTNVTDCQIYFPSVGAASAGRTNRWITLNGVNSFRKAVGTDGGSAIRIDPPSARFANGKEVNLNLEPGVVRTNVSLFEATDINNFGGGQIIAGGVVGSKKSSFLLTPQ